LQQAKPAQWETPHAAQGLGGKGCQLLAEVSFSERPARNVQALKLRQDTP
jgi:hypothetical protein